MDSNDKYREAYMNTCAIEAMKALIQTGKQSATRGKSDAEAIAEEAYKIAYAMWQESMSY